MRAILVCMLRVHLGAGRRLRKGGASRDVESDGSSPMDVYGDNCHLSTIEAGVYAEMQCGSYIYMDADYGRNRERGANRPRLRAEPLRPGDGDAVRPRTAPSSTPASRRSRATPARRSSATSPPPPTSAPPTSTAASASRAPPTASASATRSASSPATANPPSTSTTGMSGSRCTICSSFIMAIVPLGPRNAKGMAAL